MDSLERIPIQAGSSRYEAVVGRGAAAFLPELLSQAGLVGPLRLIMDERVSRTHGLALQRQLEASGRPLACLAISGQERDKNLATVSRVYDWLVEKGTDRSAIILALGGGVVGDLVGFVAASFLRGVRLVQLPTTLLAMVDSSIGGKTGIDHPGGKNLIGAFHQPGLVVADLDFLRTLPPRELAGGWAEVIKMGVIRSAELFERLEERTEAMLDLGPEASWAIARSIDLKGQVVAADEREADLRMVLNYGHTIGHAVEAATRYERFLHGEAVAIGMVGAAEIAHRLGYLSRPDRDRQNQLLERFGLPTAATGLTPQQLWGPMRRDKKAVQARLRWVLPQTIGAVAVHDDVPEPVVDQVLAELVRD